MLVTARRRFVGLHCPHVKNWVANSSHALFFIKNPAAPVVKGFMVGTMNPFSWDVGVDPPCMTNGAAKCPRTGAPIINNRPVCQGPLEARR
jgi:hypothetical protein